MSTIKEYYFHIYYKREETNNFLFNCLVPINDEAPAEDQFNFFFVGDLGRGDHFKVLFRFGRAVTKEYVEQTYMSKVLNFLQLQPSGPLEPENYYPVNFFKNYPNNSIQKFDLHLDLWFTDNEFINEKLLNFFSKYTPQFLEYRGSFNQDLIFAATIVLSDSILNILCEDKFEKGDFAEWHYKERMPTADDFSRKDKEIRKLKKKQIKDLTESMRRSYLEQKDTVNSLIEAYADDVEETDFDWLQDFRKDLVELKYILKEEKYTLPNWFKYTSNTKTQLTDQEKWPVLERFFTHVFGTLGVFDDACFYILFILKEHYKIEEKKLAKATVK